MYVSAVLASLQKGVLINGWIIKNLKQNMTYQMIEDWLAFGSLRISKLGVIVLDTAPKICHTVYLHAFAHSKVSMTLPLPAPADVNT